MPPIPRVHLAFLSAVKYGMAVAAAFHFWKTAPACLASPRVSLGAPAGTQSSLQTEMSKIRREFAKSRETATCYAREG